MMFFIGIAAWLLLTCLPVTAAILCWRLARYVRVGWIVHLSFVPAVLMVGWLLIDLLFWAANDNGEGPPGLGFAMIPAFTMFVVSVPIYYGALLIAAVRAFIEKRRIGFGRTT